MKINIFKSTKISLSLILICLAVSYGCSGNNADDSDDYYTILFHKNDGSGDVKTQRVLKDSTETLTVTLMPNEFERDTHEFVGWSRYGDNFKDQAEIQLNSSISLEAIWILNKAGELKIRQDYLAKLITEFPETTIEDISIETYYGTFGANDVIRMDDKYSAYDDTERTFVFGRYGEPLLIRYSGFDRVFIWNNGSFYGLDSNDVTLFFYYNTRIVNSLGIGFWDFNRIVNRLNGLSIEMEQIIVENINQNQELMNIFYFQTIERFWSRVTYYVAYNDSVVFRDDIYRYEPSNIFVGGQVFLYGSPIYVWKTGEIYALREAYSLDLLTEEDISNIAYYNNLGHIDLHQYIYVNYWDRLTIFIPDFHLYESNFYLNVNNLDELKELYDSGLFTEEVLRAIAVQNSLNYDLLFGGK